MGLFGIGKKRAQVTVHGASMTSGGADGRYGKQARKNRKATKEKEKNVALEPHTPDELRKYIEEKYGVTELEQDDDRYKKAYFGIKSQLVFTYAPDLLSTKEMKMPKHPPVSDDDPDYAEWRRNENARWKEAVSLPSRVFKMRLHVYNIPVFLGEVPVSWIEVYVESEYEYLSFKVIDLEYPDHYLTKRTIRDIVNYFGAGPEDKKAKNARYLQLISMQ